MSSTTKPSKEAKRTVDAFLAERERNTGGNPHRQSATRGALRATADRMLKGGPTAQAIIVGLEYFEQREHYEMPSAFQPLLKQLCESIKTQGGKP